MPLLSCTREIVEVTPPQESEGQSLHVSIGSDFTTKSALTNTGASQHIEHMYAYLFREDTPGDGNFNCFYAVDMDWTPVEGTGISDFSYRISRDAGLQAMGDRLIKVLVVAVDNHPETYNISDADSRTGFSFDAVSTGFLISEEQTRIVADYCRKMHRNGTYIFVDPIMGDNGKLYNGVTSKTIEYMRKMCSVAHIVMPNFTEAVFLADMYREKQTLTKEEAEKLLNTIHGMGAGSVVVTSADVEGKSATLVYDEKDNNTYTIPFDEIPIRFPGTGDIFASVLIGNYLTGRSLKSSVKSAMKTIEKLIALNRDNLDKYKGIPIERYLEEIIYEQTEN